MIHSGKKKVHSPRTPPKKSKTQKIEIRSQQTGNCRGIRKTVALDCSSKMMAAHSGMGPEGLLAGAELLSRPAEEFENDPSVELMWAKKAYEHSEIYFNILRSVDPTLLKLTPNDDEIYEIFRKDFPQFCVQIVNEDEMKNSAGKEQWREYCEKFKNKVADYSFGTLLRKDCTGEYTEENSILVTRIQFLAIELARNREGHNNSIRSKYKPDKNQEA